MSQISILLADNHTDYLSSCSELLQSKGYRVLSAVSPDEARAVAKKHHVHLAILDMRLLDDSDEKDKSGLRLAKTLPDVIPKIILTRFPTYRDVVEALKAEMDGLPPAVDFLDKRDGLDSLLEAVRQAIRQYVPVNYELAIEWEGLLSFAQLVRIAEPDPAASQTADRAAELEELFRTLFNRYEQITVGEIYTHDNGRVYLPVFAFDQQGGSQPFMVTCGLKTAVSQEHDKYETGLPPGVGLAKRGAATVEYTVHYGALAYPFMSHDLEEVRPLRQAIRGRSPADAAALISHLYTENLSRWYRQRRFQASQEALREFYRTWLGLDVFFEDGQRFQERLAHLCDQAYTASLVQIDYHPAQLTLHWSNAESRAYPNPAAAIHNGAILGHSAGQWGISHGQITLDTVLVDHQAQSCLINFAHVAEAPILRDFVSLEIEIRREFLATVETATRHKIETFLLDGSHFIQQAEIELPEVGERVGFALALIVQIRQLALTLSRGTFESYLVGLFFYALRELTAYDPATHYTRRPLANYVQALILAAVLADHLVENEQQAVPQQALTSLWIDKDNKTVWVEGEPVTVTLQEFKILEYLYEHVGQLCERQAIIEEGLNEPFDQFDPEQSRLNSAISRLRQKIEPEPNKPTYLLTVRGYGYKLMLT